MRKKVLVVDNREHYRFLLETYFLIRGFSVRTAKNVMKEYQFLKKQNRIMKLLI